ncbi:Hypothetical protein DHA2_150642, partial [Giardia duodenalis]
VGGVNDLRVISHASRHHSSVQAGSVRLCQPSTPGLPSLAEGLTWVTCGSILASLASD